MDSAGGHIADDGAGRREIGRVVSLDPVVEHAGRLAALDFQIGQVEHEDAAGIVGGDIVVDVGKGRILDLDAGDVVLGAGIANDDLTRLADINAGVGRADGD